MSKLIYIPIWYKGILLDVLYSFYSISKIRNSDPALMYDTEVLTKGMKSKYWVKLTLYGEYDNIIQS